jgi:hypothetical protein
MTVTTLHASVYLHFNFIISAMDPSKTAYVQSTVQENMAHTVCAYGLLPIMQQNHLGQILGLKCKQVLAWTWRSKSHVMQQKFGDLLCYPSIHYHPFADRALCVGMLSKCQFVKGERFALWAIL